MEDDSQINRNNNFQTFPQAVLLLFRYKPNQNFHAYTGWQYFQQVDNDQQWKYIATFLCGCVCVFNIMHCSLMTWFLTSTFCMQTRQSISADRTKHSIL